MGHFKPYNQDQRYLLPPDMREWLPEGHLALFISDVVDTLDLEPMLRRMVRKDGRGGERYHPRLLTKLLVYGYSTGRFSSRRIERATHDDVAFRVLAGDQHPDHDTMATFRKDYLLELSGIFLQVLRLCQKAGLVKLGHVALDGTKIRANASKHKAMTYGRMSTREKELKAQIDELMKKAAAADDEDDKKHGQGNSGEDLPGELRFRQKRLEKIQEAKAALEREAKEEAQKRAAEAERKNALRRGKKKPGPKHEVEDVQKAKPEDSKQRNFTDPDSRIMIDGATKGFVQAYNAQVVADDAHQIIVAAEVVANGNDRQMMEPMAKLAANNAGQSPKQISADAGYFAEEALRRVEASGVWLLVPPDRIKHGASEAELTKSSPRSAYAMAMREKLSTEVGRQTYKRRKAIVEPIFGQLKQARQFRQFSLRGLNQVRAEWLLLCACHNIRKLFTNGVSFAPSPA